MTDGVNVSEQWLLEGDCSVCRRKRYCTKVRTKEEVNENDKRRKNENL